MKTTIETIKKLYVLPQNYQNGFTQSEITQAESRLAVNFPQNLIDFYKILGKNEQINEIYNRLLPPDAIFIEDNHLIFYEENQNVCFWAIKLGDLSNDNPPIYEGYKNWEKNTMNWYSSHQNITDFWLYMAFYNGTMGGLKYHANILNEHNIDPKAVAHIIKTKIELTALKMENQSFYTSDNKEVISICHDNGTHTAVFVGTQDEARFEAILELFGYDAWSYTSYDDDDEDDDDF